MLCRLNLDGDEADLKAQAGRIRPCVIPTEHYVDWRRELARDDFMIGRVGENVTDEEVVASVR